MRSGLELLWHNAMPRAFEIGGHIGSLARCSGEKALLAEQLQSVGQ